MRTRVFKQPTTLYSMLLLRQAGMVYKQIAVVYGCDFTTVYHHCSKYGVRPTVTITASTRVLGILAGVPEDVIVERLNGSPIPTAQLESQWYTDSNGDRYNRGFDYKDYLRKHASKL